MTDFIHFVLPGLPERKEKELAREILTALKHLPGGHDQLSHGGHGGMAMAPDKGGAGGGTGNLNAENQRYQDLMTDAKARVETLHSQKSKIFGDVPTQELHERRDIFLKNMERSKLSYDKEFGKAEYEKWKSKRDEAGNEISRRIELGKYQRRVKALEESMKTGKLTVSESEMIEILNNKGDTYYDNNYIKNKFGRSPEYNIDMMRTSDLTGANIRFYVTLPDGRIAHPDELIEAQQRGRLVVYR